MPRPKVRPEDRQRSCKACLACKASKIRCDAQLPCASCVRRNQATSCAYPIIDRRRRHHSTTDHSTGQPAETSPTTVVPNADGYASLIGGPLNLASSTGPVTPDPSSDSGQPGDRLLISSTNDKVYVGETSSLSFLHFLRKTVRAYVGTVSFTDGERHQTMFEAEFGEVGNDKLDSTPEEMYSLMDSYFEVASGLLDLFTADEIDTLIVERGRPGESASPSPAKRTDAAALDVALAIGAQAWSSSDASSPLAQGYFSRARKVAFEDMLIHQSTSQVRLFLLLAFYMLGACHRNAASMYLGVAAKAAIVLGLHNSASYKGLTKEEYTVRLRTWNSLQTIDVLTSFILGRPKSLPVVRHVTRQMEMTGEEGPQHLQSAFDAVLKGCSLLDEIVDKLSKGKLLHVPTAEGLLEQLRQWSRGFPPDWLRFSFASGDGNTLDFASRQMLTGNMHVSCVYYFAVILITRPFLIAYLVSRLRGRAPDHLISDPEEASDVNIKNNPVSKLAQVCVGSAIYMANMCQKAKASNFRFANLCLLKAWIFGAGLVLGFSMFAGEPRKDIDDAFQGACEVLESIAVMSPQARLYHEILVSFSAAVRKYRRQVSCEVRRTVQHYMDQILIIDPPHRADGAGHGSSKSNFGGVNVNLASQLAGTLETLNANASAFELMARTEGTPTSTDIAAYGEMQVNWDSVDSQFIYDPILDTEPFERLFCTIE